MKAIAATALALVLATPAHAFLQLGKKESTYLTQLNGSWGSIDESDESNCKKSPKTEEDPDFRVKITTTPGKIELVGWEWRMEVKVTHLDKAIRDGFSVSFVGTELGEGTSYKVQGRLIYTETAAGIRLAETIHELAKQSDEDTKWHPLKGKPMTHILQKCENRSATE